MSDPNLNQSNENSNAVNQNEDQVGQNPAEQNAAAQGAVADNTAVNNPNAPKKTNTLAIVALVGSFFVSLVGIICGHIALKQIKRTGEGGRGLALAGTIIGYVATVFWIIFIIIAIIASIAGAKVIEEEIKKQEQLQSETQTESTDPTAPGSDSLADEGATSEPGTEAAAGEYSLEYCQKLQGVIVEASGIEGDLSTSPEARTQLGELVATLAPLESPHQAEYQKLESDPSSITPEYVEYLNTDGLACGDVLAQQ